MSRSKAIVCLLLLGIVLAVCWSVRTAGDGSADPIPADLKSSSTASSAVSATPSSPASESPTPSHASERAALDPPAAAQAASEPSGEFGLFVRVVSSPRNTPVADAAFSTAPSQADSLARALSGNARPALTPARSHGDGLYELHFKTDLPLALCVRAPHCSARAIFVTRGHERAEDACVVALERSSVLVLRLVDREKQPLGGARIDASVPVAGLIAAALNSESASPATAGWSGETDAAGRVELADLPARVPLEITVLREGARIFRHKESIVLEPEERRELEIALGATAVVRGRMIDELDAPVADHEVWLVEVDPRFLDNFDAGTVPLAHATTDANGAFQFEAVREGEWLIGPAFVARGSVSDEKKISSKVERFEVGADTEFVELTLHVLRGLFVSGVVLDEHDAPVKSCIVRITSEQGERSWIKSNERGEFRLGPLASGRHELVTGGAGAWCESRPVDVLAGTRGVVLRATRGAKLEGRIVATDGRKKFDGRIEVALIEAGELVSAWGPVATRGRFELQGLNAGTYDIIVVGRGTQVCSARVELAAGEQREIELPLQAGATLVIENRSDEALSIQLRNEGRFLGLHPLGKLSPLQMTVPAGTLELRFLDAQQQRVATQSVTLEAGEERRVSHPPQ